MIVVSAGKNTRGNEPWNRVLLARRGGVDVRDARVSVFRSGVLLERLENLPSLFPPNDIVRRSPHDEYRFSVCEK